MNRRDGVLNTLSASVLMALASLTACSDPIEDCVAKKQDAYREAHPKADYGVASTANEKFRLECELSVKRR